MARVLVLGASGYVGSHLILRLVERGHEVRAAGRRPEALAGRGWEGVEPVRADALDPESLAQAFEEIELVYYLIHSMAAGKDFPELDRQAAAHVRDAAAHAGVGRIIYLGGLQPGKRLRHTSIPGGRQVRCSDRVPCRSPNSAPGSSWGRARRLSRSSATSFTTYP